MADSANTGAKLESEKSKDIRATNVIAAKGKFCSKMLIDHVFSCC